MMNSGFDSKYTQMGYDPKHDRGPEYKPGSGVFGIFVTAVIILVIALVILWISSAGNNADNVPAETQEEQQESVDEIGFLTRSIFEEADV